MSSIRLWNGNNISEISHPSVRAVLSEAGIEDGLELHYDGGLPARSGIGSSSTFTVGMLNAINALLEREMDKKALADEVIRIEQDVIGEAVGSQDQVLCAHGGFNRVDFGADGRIEVRPLVLSEEKRDGLFDHLMLVSLGSAHNAPDIEAQKIANLAKHEVDFHRLHQLVTDAE